MLQNRNIGIQQECLHGDTPARIRHVTAANPCGNLILNLNCCMAQAIASSFFEEHRPQKLPIHGLYARVMHDSCLPCKRYCRAASPAAACNAPVTMFVASHVNIPWHDRYNTPGILPVCGHDGQPIGSNYMPLETVGCPSPGNPRSPDGPGP